jgi:hypothetical protein
MTVTESVIITVHKSFVGLEIRLRDLYALCCTVLHESHFVTLVVEGCSAENWCGALELHVSMHPECILIYLFIYLLVVYFKTMSIPHTAIFYRRLIVVGEQ